MSKSRRPFAVILLASALLGCSLDCTLIGCWNGLVVTLASSPTGSFSVTILENGVAVPNQTISCASTSACPSLVFNDYLGANPTVRVVSAAGTKDTPFTNVAYAPQYPNGKRCGAACRQGNVTAAIP